MGVSVCGFSYRTGRERILAMTSTLQKHYYPGQKRLYTRSSYDIYTAEALLPRPETSLYKV